MSNIEKKIETQTNKISVNQDNKDKVFVETYGCQMNVYDTELVKRILTTANYEIVTQIESADVVMLNTCSVRDNANRKVYNRIHTIRQIKGKENTVKIGILGCMATNFRKNLLDDSKLKIDFIAGPDSYKQLPHLIAATGEQQEKPFDVTLSEFETYSDIYPMREKGVNAWIAVMRGCNNYCSFCVVPFTRGRERSRSPESVVEEVKQLVADGYKQVTLLGQNVNSYKSEENDFTELMRQVSDVEGMERIFFTSPHPKDFPTKLLTLMSERDNICNQVHMPLQAGNNRILDMMNRTYTKEEFLTLIEETRRIIPNVVITTDIIVGFPTETEEEFQDTMDVVKKAQFDSAFIFKYSERKAGKGAPSTLAAKRYPDDVCEEDKKDRVIRLNAIQSEITLQKNSAHIGETHTVLIEKKGSKKSNDAYVGRNQGNKLTIIADGDYQVGDIATVSITGATPHALMGKPKAV
tara:strand:+ start:226 stop:1623 length:1398 start_codon:yes stop_codon:yes gene_type:complete